MRLNLHWTFSKIPTTAHLHRDNFALCATNEPVMMSIDEDMTRSTIKVRSKENTVAVQGRRVGEFLDHEVAGRTIDFKIDIRGR
jgi:hypothetical protein